PAAAGALGRPVAGPGGAPPPLRRPRPLQVVSYDRPTPHNPVETEEPVTLHVAERLRERRPPLGRVAIREEDPEFAVANHDQDNRKGPWCLISSAYFTR